MGIILLFDWGEANALFFMGKFTLINKARSRIREFEPLKIVLKTIFWLTQFKSPMVVFLSDQVSKL